MICSNNIRFVFVSVYIVQVKLFYMAKYALGQNCCCFLMCVLSDGNAQFIAGSMSNLVFVTHPESPACVPFLFL